MDVGCWVMGDGCRILDYGFWILDFGGWVGCWRLVVEVGG